MMLTKLFESICLLAVIIAAGGAGLVFVAPFPLLGIPCLSVALISLIYLIRTWL